MERQKRWRAETEIGEAEENEGDDDEHA